MILSYSKFTIDYLVLHNVLQYNLIYYNIIYYNIIVRSSDILYYKLYVDLESNNILPYRLSYFIYNHFIIGYNGLPTIS
jgi:hypothetical protein